jgi:hypothetical protein
MTKDHQQALGRGFFFAIPSGLVGAMLGAHATGTLSGALFVAGFVAVLVIVASWVDR